MVLRGDTRDPSPRRYHRRTSTTILGGTMSGHVAKPRRRWPWVILSFLFALAFAWSFAVTGEQVGGVSSILRIGSAVGLGISLLLLVLTFISSRRQRRAQGDEGSEVGADGQQPGDQS